MKNATNPKIDAILRAKKTATAAYAEANAEATRLAEALLAKLAAHKAQAAADPTNWGMVGDMNHIAAELKNLLDPH